MSTIINNLTLILSKLSHYKSFIYYREQSRWKIDENAKDLKFPQPKLFLSSALLSAFPQFGLWLSSLSSRYFMCASKSYISGWVFQGWSGHGCLPGRNRGFFSTIQSWNCFSQNRGSGLSFFWHILNIFYTSSSSS